MRESRNNPSIQEQIPTQPLDFAALEDEGLVAQGNALAEGEGDAYDKQEQWERIRDLQQDRGERKNYARKIFWLVVCWLIGIFVLLIVDSIDMLPVSVPEKVWIVVIVGTTGNVFGLFYIVANYLFWRAGGPRGREK